MLIAEYFVRFIFFSFLGWIYECTYCTVKSGHWENRGFLIGPVCPIYGFGAVGAWVIFTRLHIFKNGLMGTEQPVWKIFLICAIGSAILEYSISWLLERLFNAKWWDYSDTPLNINGRICLPATCAFGVAGVLIVKFFFPWYAGYEAVALSHPLINEMVALAFMLILGMDIALTEASLTSLLEMLDEAQEKFDKRMEAGVETISAMPDRMKEKAAAGVSAIAQTPEKIKGMTPRIPMLSWRQSYHLRTIKKFTKPQHSSRADQLRAAAGTIKRHTIEKLKKDKGYDSDR